MGQPNVTNISRLIRCTIPLPHTAYGFGDLQDSIADAQMHPDGVRGIDPLLITIQTVAGSIKSGQGIRHVQRTPAQLVDRPAHQNVIWTHYCSLAIRPMILCYRFLMNSAGASRSVN
jgi:hypothetical protein